VTFKALPRHHHCSSTALNFPPPAAFTPPSPDPPPLETEVLGRYAGQFVVGRMEGSGAYVWREGDAYAGEYMDDERHGFGIYLVGGGVEGNLERRP
jgi:hypothetical protein